MNKQRIQINLDLVKTNYMDCQEINRCSAPVILMDKYTKFSGKSLDIRSGHSRKQ